MSLLLTSAPSATTTSPKSPSPADNTPQSRYLVHAPAYTHHSTTLARTNPALPGCVVLHVARPNSGAIILSAASGPSSCPRQPPREISAYVRYLWSLSFWPLLPLFRNAASIAIQRLLEFPGSPKPYRASLA